MSYFQNKKINKISYPVYDEFQNIAPSPDLTKWLDTLKSIYFQERNGISKNSATDYLTKDWDEAEKTDFKTWFKFYEEGTHLKYKKAQNLFNGSSPGYFIPLGKPDQETAKENIGGKDIDYAKSLISNEMTVAEKKSIIERQRSKIIGRLDSAEKLLRSKEGDLFAGDELENLIEAIYSLKKKVQVMNKMSLSTKIYDDMIIREANVLVKNGFSMAGDVLFSLSEEAPQAALPTAPMPDLQIEKKDTAINAFLKNMESANISMEDEEENLDVNLVDDELEVSLFSEAQEVPVAPVQNDAVAPPPADSSLANFDEKLNQVFSDISVDDVVIKLEEIANVFRTREVPRQLGVIDMMLDSLGLASLFSNLPEAVNKSLEANNYCLTRIEDIISKLRGSMKTTPMELTENSSPTNPQAAQIKNKLQNDLDKEKERKEKRKETENLKEDTGTPVPGKEVPQIELEDPNPTPAAPLT